MARLALTGGATGIGRAVRDRAEALGHDLVVVDLRDADITADLSTAHGRRSAIDGIRAAAPDGLDALVTCAGVGSHVPDCALISSVNFYGSVELVQGLRPLLEMRRGAVVMVSSNSAPLTAGRELAELLLNSDEEQARAAAVGMRGHDVYSASKLALTRWMRRNAPDYAGAGVRLNAVAPGYTETPMTEVVANDAQYGPAIRAFRNSIPVGRAGEPQDIAACIEFLLSPAASFVCGSVLFVDGGHDALHRPDSF